jgi:hypothetical protein
MPPVQQNRPTTSSDFFLHVTTRTCSINITTVRDMEQRQSCEFRLGAEKVMMRADGDEANYIQILVIENGAIVSRYVDASMTCVGIVEGMVIENGAKRISKKQISAFFELCA